MRHDCLCPQAGRRRSCVTNAFWARTDAVALEKLRTLARAGFAAAGRQRQRVPRAVRAARQRGARAARRGATGDRNRAQGRGDQQRPGRGRPGNAVARNCSRRTRSASSPSFRICALVFRHCRSPSITASRDFHRQVPQRNHHRPGRRGRVELLGQSPQTGFLRIGNTRSEPLAVIHQRFRHAHRQRVLRHCGPIAFARRAIDAGHGHLLRDAYAGPCDLCLHIGSDPELRRSRTSCPYRVKRSGKTTIANKRRVPVENGIDNVLLSLLAKAAANAEVLQAAAGIAGRRGR